MAQRIVTVSVEGEGERLVPVGTPLLAILGRRSSSGQAILGATLNNRLVSLAAPIRGVSHVVPVTDLDRQGATIYRRSIAIVFARAVWELLPTAELRIGQSIGDGYFFEFGDGAALQAPVLAKVESRMREIVAEDLPMVEELVDINEAIATFEREGATERVRLLSTLRVPAVPILRLGERHYLLHGPVAPSTGSLGGFELVPHEDGAILRFPSPQGPHHEVANVARLFKVYRDTRRWNEIVGVSDVGQFNQLCVTGGLGEVVRVAEGLHERKVIEIADRILGRRDVKVVLVAGPSASGKTTFSKRLAVQLRVGGARPVAVSLDDYYVDRDQTPLDASGNPDFEAVEALDLRLLNEHLGALVAGERVRVPRFDFRLGRRAPEPSWAELRLEPETILILEGIHGLNERITEAVPSANKFLCYVSALTQLTIDNHERIFTSDTRLLRRLVRDRHFRGYSGQRTIDMWPAVRRGEERHIFPFQERADAIFNSALVYEAAVLKTYAERFLLEVPTDSGAFVEADRLLRFLSLFVPVLDEEVPHGSILREFVGGSSFRY